MVWRTFRLAGASEELFVFLGNVSGEELFYVEWRASLFAA